MRFRFLDVNATLEGISEYDSENLNPANTKLWVYYAPERLLHDTTWSLCW
jgi:hypothetical protein